MRKPQIQEKCLLFCLCLVCAFFKEIRKKIEFEVEVKIIDVYFVVLTDLKGKRNYHFGFAFSLRTHKAYVFFCTWYFISLSFILFPTLAQSITNSHTFLRILCAEVKLIDLFSTMQNDNCHIPLLHRTMLLLDMFWVGVG